MIIYKKILLSQDIFKPIPGTIAISRLIVLMALSLQYAIEQGYVWGKESVRLLKTFEGQNVFSVKIADKTANLFVVVTRWQISQDVRCDVS